MRIRASGEGGEEEGGALRRRLSLAALVAALVLALLPVTQAPAVGALRASGKIVAQQVDHSMPALTVGELRTQGGEPVVAASAVDAGASGERTLFVTSPVINPGQLFERIGVHYRAARGTEDSMFVEVRASPDGRAWTDWRLVVPDEDTADPATNTFYIAPHEVPQDSRYGQYRVWLTRGVPADLEHIALTFLDVNDLNADPLTRLGNDLRGALADMLGGDQALAATGASKMLTRQDWGADEALMKWTPKYVPWQKAIVHHTVTGDGGNNVAAEIRAMYYFHAVTRGWGDIGYNFIADKYGNIWIGRQGGDNVVGGHAFGWNDGTFAVAALGDYSVAAPTSALQGAVANVIAMKFKQLGIAPYGSGAYTHREQTSSGEWVYLTSTVANVLGHRDCTYEVGKTGGQTACPGGRLYGILDGLRGLAQNAWQQGYTQMTRLVPQLPTGGYPGQQLVVPVALTNLGSETIPADTQVVYKILRGGQVVTQGRGVGIGQAVASGGTAAVMVPFTAPPAGQYIVRWDLQTGSAAWSQVFNTPFRDTWFRSADWSATWLRADIGNTWTAGETRMASVTVRNDGGRVWNATGTNPVKLGYYWIATSGPSAGDRFDAEALLPLPRDVQPGETMSLTLPIVAPVYPTNYVLTLDLYKQNEFWFRDKGLRPDDIEVTVYTDFKASYTLASPPAKLESGQTVNVPVTIANLGRGTFPVTSSYPVSLGYHWYDLAGQVVTWDGARTRLPADLLKGQSVTLSAPVTAPEKGGTYQLRFDLVQEGVGWFSSKGVPTKNVSVTVQGPVIPVYGATYQPGVSTLALSGGLTAIPFTLVNNSNFTWSPGGERPVNLSYHWIGPSGQTVVWEGLRTALPQDVTPGQRVALDAQVAFPTAQGTYTLRWDLVQEGVAWFSGKGVAPFDQTAVVGPRFYGGSMDVSAVPGSMAAGQTLTVPLRVQNMSNFDWDAFVNLAYHWYDAAGGVVVWDGARTPLKGIRVGDVRAVDATVQVPAAAGTYTLRFDVVHEGVAWFSGQGMQLAPVRVSVERASFGASYATVETVAGAPNSTVSVPLALSNNGGVVWQPGAVNVAYHLIAASGNVYVWDGQRTTLPRAVEPGQTVVVDAVVRTPPTAGTWTIRFDLVQEGVTWFSGMGIPTGSATLVVQ